MPEYKSHHETKKKLPIKNMNLRFLCTNLEPILIFKN